MKDINHERLDVIKGWTANSKIYKKGKEILKNFEWDALIADKAYSERVPEDPGLYIFSTTVKINDHILRNPFYIGESDWSIRDRFKDHIYKKEWQDMYITYGNKFTYSYYLTNDCDADKLLEWETILIKMFMPKYNMKVSKKNISSVSE